MGALTAIHRPAALRWALCIFFAAVAPAAYGSAPTLRVQTDQRGDFVLIGNTLAHECRTGAPAPVAGTVGNCGTNVHDGSPDIFWRADGGTALADVSIAPASARTHSVLALPQGAQVTHARLYWAATSSLTPDAGVAADTQVRLHLPNGQSLHVQADDSWTSTATSDFYQATSDVTSLVQAQGAGRYGVEEVDASALANQYHQGPFAAWSLVVFYSLASEPQRNLTLFDGFMNVDSVSGAAPITLSGFKVPNAGFSARLGVVAFDGDTTLSGDDLLFNGAKVSDTTNPLGNFFNSTRSRLGAPVSPTGDLPQLTGAAGSMSGIDLDEVDVTAQVSPGDTQATVGFTTSGDGYVLGTFVVSISTLKPDLTSSTKTVTVTSPRPSGAVRPGDEVTYAITVQNTGMDEAVDVVAEDALPTGLDFVPGSLRVGATALTDAAGDDAGEYVPASRTVRVRVGAGATSSAGGSLPVGASATVSFTARVAQGASQSVANIAEVTAAGKLGTPTFTTKTNGGDAVALPVEEVPPPAVLAPAEGALLATASPQYSGTVEVGSQVEVRVDGTVICLSAPAAAGSWQCEGAALGDGPHQGEAVTVDALGNRSVATAFTFQTDTTAPAAPVIETPEEGALLNASPAAITGTSEPLAVVRVSIDGAEACAATATAQGKWTCALTATLDDCAHVASAIAEDAAQHRSAAAERTFTIDSKPPETLIQSGPARVEPALEATFDLASDEDGVRYECALDGADFSPCDDPFLTGEVTETTHSFRARAVDAAGNADPTPATYEWTASLRRGQVRDGCGCGSAGSAGVLPLALLVFAVALRRRSSC